VSGDDKLIRMANQITGFFRSYPDAEAMAGIAEHIKAFWTPKMRRNLAQQIAAGAPGLDPLVAQALRGGCVAESPVHKEVAGPDEVGQMASDAG
jgi:formate dehydrogenase subunit delta